MDDITFMYGRGMRQATCGGWRRGRGRGQGTGRHLHACGPSPRPPGGGARRSRRGCGPLPVDELGCEQWPECAARLCAEGVVIHGPVKGHVGVLGADAGEEQAEAGVSDNVDRVAVEVALVGLVAPVHVPGSHRIRSGRPGHPRAGHRHGPGLRLEGVQPPAPYRRHVWLHVEKGGNALGQDRQPGCDAFNASVVDGNLLRFCLWAGMPARRGNVILQSTPETSNAFLLVVLPQLHWAIVSARWGNLVCMTEGHEARYTVLARTFWACRPMRPSFWHRRMTDVCTYRRMHVCMYVCRVCMYVCIPDGSIQSDSS